MQLNPVQFYHQSDQEYEPGHTLDPSQPHATNWDLSEPDHVYFDDYPGSNEWGKNTYTVAPTGHYEEDMQSTGFKTKSPLRITGRVQ